jgi:DNA-binding transcriptional MerR regulator
MDEKQYVFKSARFNRQREQDEAALQIIEHWDRQGYSFKELVTDRLIRGENVDPVMFQKGDYPYQKPATVDDIRDLLSEMPQSSGITLDEVRQLLESFADEIVRHLKKSGGRVHDTLDDDDGETVSTFAKNFARGFMQRQRKGMGEDDE